MTNTVNSNNNNKEIYGEVNYYLDYPEGSVYDAYERSALSHAELISYEYFGVKVNYGKALDKIKETAKAFIAAGVKENDRVTICLPNIPEAVLCFYALNAIGAVSNMVHPLSSDGEIEEFIKLSESKTVVILDSFYTKLNRAKSNNKLITVIVVSAADSLSPIKRFAYKLNKKNRITRQGSDMSWKEFIKSGRNTEFVRIRRDAQSPAVILYSGGTTGKTKGALLSNLNFNAVAVQTIEMARCFYPKKKMLAVMPVFHGFGLGVSIHAAQVAGCDSILIPRFNTKSFSKLLVKLKPNIIVGVPTLFEGIMRCEELRNADLSCLEGIFSGGDSLPAELQKRFNSFLSEHKAKVSVREGYGTTECVSASCLMPYNMYKEGSIGLPYPGMSFMIVKPSTLCELPKGEIGEIAISGPSVMLGYIGAGGENSDILESDSEGRKWLHTGDLGTMDKDGFVYFKQRLKRMIVTSGYSVYPSQIESIFNKHPAVYTSCVVGIPDAYKLSKVKAYVVLNDKRADKEKTIAELTEYIRHNVAKFAMPCAIEVMDSLPTTKLGKVDYRALEELDNHR